MEHRETVGRPSTVLVAMLLPAPPLAPVSAARSRIVIACSSGIDFVTKPNRREIVSAASCAGEIAGKLREVADGATEDS